MQRTQLSLMSLPVLIVLLVGTVGGSSVQAAPGREPVIVIPGVAGSEFVAGSTFTLNVDNGHGGTYSRTYNAGDKVWVNTWEAIEPGADDYFDALKLKADGITPVAPALRVSGLYGSAYNDLISYLKGQGYVDGVDLWMFPYDWRKDIRATHKDLDALVTKALTAANGGRTDPATWTTKRVDLVGHSMGGMVGRSYVADAVRAQRVDQLVTLGSPQLGATKFLKALMYGDDFGPHFLGIGLDSQEVKDVVQNMAGAMELLPASPYYTYYDNTDSSRLRPYVEDREVDGSSATKGVLGYSGVKQLLLNTGKNGTVLTTAETYHTAIDGTRTGGVNGVRWTALVGYGHGTLGQLREYTGSCWSWYRYVSCPKRDETPVDGDGTVAIMSAAMGDPWRNTLIASGAQLWYVEREHGALVTRDSTLGITTGDGPALTWLGDVLAGRIATGTTATSAAGNMSTAATIDADDGTARAWQGTTTALATRVPQGKLSGSWIAALGPVALEVSDDAGKITGRTRGAAEAAPPQIADSRYERLPGSEFVFVKHEAPYTLRLVAEEAGSTDLKVRVLGNGTVERTAVYLGVALGATGRAELVIKPGTGRANAPQGWPDLQVDADGDGVWETRVPAAAVLNEAESVDQTAPEVVITAPTAGVQGTTTAQWQATDTGAGVLREQAVLDPDTTTARELRNGERLTLSPGEHRLVVLVVDRAGNATSRETTFTVR
jgi:pimeloyl-ACP methyl ester carboxylesterase